MKEKVAPQLPKGFKAITSGIASSWQFEVMPQLVGKVEEFGEFESRYKDPTTKKFKMQRKCVVKDAKGTLYTVWESAGLRALFDNKSIKKGVEVCLMYLGKKKIAGRKLPMKDFIVAIK